LSFEYAYLTQSFGEMMNRMSETHAALPGLVERRAATTVVAPSLPGRRPGEISAVLTPAPVQRSRLDAVDFLRGLVMVIMVLDHVRDSSVPEGSIRAMSTSPHCS
jgi:hypothetical protein